ncbi:hypothetical protein F4703DRAFT_1856647 [Phycomyces blakesleeanus]
MTVHGLSLSQQATRLVLLIFLIFTALSRGETLAHTYVDSSNFTTCPTENSFTISAVKRIYNPRLNTYTLNITGAPLIAVETINQAGEFIPAARLEIMMGFATTVNTVYSFCPDVVSGCPLSAGTSINISKSVNIPASSLPLADISARYSAWTADKVPLVCATIGSVGYQNPTWRAIFIYLPAGFTAFSALVSFVASFVTLGEADRDILLFTSNYAMLPAAVRFKTPGFFDLVFYAQFIVTTGMLNLSYPMFYPLFTANFSWSFLLFSSDWINNLMTQVFPSTSNDTERAINSSGFAFNKRQLSQPLSPEPSVIIRPQINNTGTGMVNFATAVDLDINKLFLTSLLYFLIILGGCLCICFLIWAVSTCFISQNRPNLYKNHSEKIRNFTIGISLRILTLFYLPLITTAFYQLMLDAPWYLLLTASIVLVFPLCLLYGYIGFALLHIKPTSVVFSDITLLLRYGSLYNTFTDDHVHFFVLLIVYKLFVGAMVGIFQTSGIAQLVVIILAETVLLCTLVVNYPYADRRINIQYAILSIFRITITFLNIAYIESLHVLNVTKQYIAYIQLVLHCIVYLMMFVLPVKNMVILAIGLADEELYDNTVPPARMAIWRRRWKPSSMEEAGPSTERLCREVSLPLAEPSSRPWGTVEANDHQRGTSINPDRLPTSSSSSASPPPLPTHTIFSSEYRSIPTEDTVTHTNDKPHATRSSPIGGSKRHSSNVLLSYDDPAIDQPLVQADAFLTVDNSPPSEKGSAFRNSPSHRQYKPQLSPTGSNDAPNMPPYNENNS